MARSVEQDEVAKDMTVRKLRLTATDAIVMMANEGGSHAFVGHSTWERQ